MNTIPDYVFGYDFGLTLSDRWCCYNHVDPFIYGCFFELEIRLWKLSLKNRNNVNNDGFLDAIERESWHKIVNLYDL